MHVLVLAPIAGELGSYILRDTPEPWQLKVPSPRLTIKQLKEACKGTDPPLRGTDGPRRGTDPQREGNGRPFTCRKCLRLQHSLYCFNHHGSADLVRNDSDMIGTPARVRYRRRILGSAYIAGVLRGNTIRGNTTRNCERKMALWEGLWERLWKSLKTL